MDTQYLMGSDSVLVRSTADGTKDTFVSDRLLRSLRKKAVLEAFEFYAEFFGKDAPATGIDEHVVQYEKELLHGKSLGLFASGGIREKDHLNLWCLGRVFEPETYIESGVYIGSSLHAFIRCPGLNKTIAIDPNLSQLLVPKSEIPGAVLVDDKDFSQLEITGPSPRTLVYFDDHINTADRIQQAHRKGIRYLLFDDSTGFEGIAQRLYPAIPTIPTIPMIPMIKHCEIFEPGDEMSWTFCAPLKANRKAGLLERIAGERRESKDVTRVTLSNTDKLISECVRAKGLIKKCEKIPDLGQFLPQSSPEKMVDTSKYLVELK